MMRFEVRDATKTAVLAVCAAVVLTACGSRSDFGASDAEKSAPGGDGTDLLLHDMGEGLSDGRSDGTASPTEWRTSPLWGSA